MRNLTGTSALEANLADLKASLDRHPIYGMLRDLRAVRRFMESHVFAVWDFMGLLKSLQRRVTCVATPWQPPRSPELARFVNEIVLCEESDEISPGRIRSHFQLYLEAMEEVGANSTGVRALLQTLERGHDLRAALASEVIPDHVRDFVTTTLDLSESAEHVVAAAFCHGREDPIPRMFEQMIEVLDAGELPCPSFRLYLQHHCEIDGGEHGPMARKMLELLCGDDERRWLDVQNAAATAISARIRFWDAVARDLEGVSGQSEKRPLDPTAAS